MLIEPKALYMWIAPTKMKNNYLNLLKSGLNNEDPYEIGREDIFEADSWRVWVRHVSSL